MKLKKNIKCPNCGNMETVDLEDFVYDQTSEERNMGLEIEYSISYEEYQCPKCLKTSTISGSIFEYPVGAYDSDTIEVTLNDEEDDDYEEDDND